MRFFYDAHFVVSGWNGQYLGADEINHHGSRGRKISFEQTKNSWWFSIRHLPIHLLIDPDGKISQFPALPPSPLSKGYNSTTIDKTFFTIEKNNRVKESFKIGKKN